jgi:hypothetical protein
MEDRIILGVAILVGVVALTTLIVLLPHTTTQERVREAGKECYHIGYRIEVERVATLQCVEGGYRQ